MIEQGVLTKYIDGDCTVNRTWNPIVCNTAVCHTISSVDIYNMPGISNKQHLILWHSVSIIIFGAGLPVALQNKVRFEPSFTIWLLQYDVILGGTERKEYDNVRLWYRLIIRMKKFFIVTLILKGSGKQLQYIYYALCNSHCIQCNYHIL